MNTREKLIKARLGMLALAEELQNISLACRRAGISRSHFYEIKEAFEKYGAEGLAPRNRRRPRMPNQTPPELEQKILEMTERYPTFSYLRISQQLRLVGIGVSPSAVRYVWQRYGLTLRYHRLLWLERSASAPDRNHFGANSDVAGAQFNVEGGHRLSSYLSPPEGHGVRRSSAKQSRKMLGHSSHFRMEAKRVALDAIAPAPKQVRSPERVCTKMCTHFKMSGKRQLPTD
jgi:transposase